MVQTKEITKAIFVDIVLITKYVNGNIVGVLQNLKKLVNQLNFYLHRHKTVIFDFGRSKLL